MRPWSPSLGRQGHTSLRGRFASVYYAKWMARDPTYRVTAVLRRTAVAARKESRNARISQLCLAAPTCPPLGSPWTCHIAVNERIVMDRRSSWSDYRSANRRRVRTTDVQHRERSILRLRRPRYRSADHAPYLTRRRGISSAIFGHSWRHRIPFLRRSDLAHGGGSSQDIRIRHPAHTEPQTRRRPHAPSCHFPTAYATRQTRRMVQFNGAPSKHPSMHPDSAAPCQTV